MNFEVVEKSIYKDGKPLVSFDYLIEKTIEYDSSIVILLDSDNYPTNNNALAINKSGERIWQISSYDFKGRSPYVDLFRLNDNEVKIFNWEGSFVVIEANSGKVVIDAISSRKGRRPW